MIIYNNYIPVKGFSAMAIWPFIFVRKDAIYGDVTENHEKIHFAQQKELFIIGFWVLYLFFHLMRGYDLNPLEREAYLHSKDKNYLLNRKPLYWRNYK